MPERKAWLNQAWSGDMIVRVPVLLPTRRRGRLLSSGTRAAATGPIQNDMWSICSTTKKPVLAHLFLNYMLDNSARYKNFVNYNGYQPPLTEVDPDDDGQEGRHARERCRTPC